MKKALVLGGNGYIGSKIINNLFSDYIVYCTIRNGEGLNLLVKTPNIITVSDDINEIKKVILENKIDIIFNTVCCYERYGVPLSGVINANLIFPISIISFAIENGVNKIITIDTSLPRNVNLYATTKKMVAEIGKYYTGHYDNLAFYNVLLENFYGKDEPKNRFLHILVDKMKKNENVDLTIGTQKRDFIYIDDVLSAFNILINHQDVGYYDIPVGTGEGPTIKEIVVYLKDIIQSNSTLNFGAVNSRTNEPNCVADISYLQSLGYKIKYPYKIGLKEII